MASLKPSRGVPPSLNVELAPDDGMYDGGDDHYVDVGRSALLCVESAMRAAGKYRIASVLDLPSGHGRVLRVLKWAFPDARLAACDIDSAGVEFCARKFGATPYVSHVEPGKIEIPETFDLIWCGSLLTHLPAAIWASLLAFFETHLGRRGLLIFTTHGRTVCERISAGRADYGLGANANALVQAYERDGFGYHDYAGTPGYGVSVATPEWTVARVSQRPGLRLVGYVERGWDDHQDVVSCVLRG